MSYYERLGLPADATPEELKERYRALAKALHPDLHEGEDVEERVARMAELNEAYHVLSDPQLRATYDQELAHKGVSEAWERTTTMSARPKPARVTRALALVTLLGLLVIITLNRRSPNQRQLTQELNVVKPMIEPKVQGALKRGDLPSLEEGLSDPRATLLRGALMSPNEHDELTVERCLERFPEELQAR